MFFGGFDDAADRQFGKGKSMQWGDVMNNPWLQNLPFEIEHRWCRKTEHGDETHGKTLVKAVDWASMPTRS